MATPLERFSRRTLTTNLPMDATVAIDRSGDEWVTRTVASTGVIAVSAQVFSVGKHRARHIVDVKVTDSTLEVWDGNEFLKAVLRTTKGESGKSGRSARLGRNNEPKCHRSAVTDLSHILRYWTGPRVRRAPA